MKWGFIIMTLASALNAGVSRSDGLTNQRTQEDGEEVATQTSFPTRTPSSKPSIFYPTQLPTLLPTSTPTLKKVEWGSNETLIGDGNITSASPSSEPIQSPTFSPSLTLQPTMIPSMSPTEANNLTSSPPVSFNGNGSITSISPSYKPSQSTSSEPSQSLSTSPSLSPIMSATESNTLTFFAIGDVPYSDLEACLIPHELDKAANSGADAKFLIHLGDIRDGKPYPSGKPRPCPEYLYEDVATIFENSFVPTFFVMGDNAWLDCENVDESYTFWKKHLLKFNDRKDLGWPELGATVSRNEDHIEMYSFVLKEVLVIVQGLPGRGRSDGHAWDRWNLYLQENARWMEKSLSEFKDEYKAVIICGNSSKGWNEKYFKRLEKVAQQYADIPIMFLGDEHYFQEEVEFRGVPNLHRIALDDVVTPTLITVDPYASGTENVFTYDRRCPCAGNHRPTELFTYTSGKCAGVCDTNDLCINEDADSVLWGEE